MAPAQSSESWNRWARLSAIVLLPVFLQSTFVVSAELLQHAVPWYGNFASQIASTCIGLLLLVRHFGWRALIFAVVYGPLMFGGLVYFTLVFAGIVFGDAL